MLREVVKKPSIMNPSGFELFQCISQFFVLLRIIGRIQGFLDLNYRAISNIVPLLPRSRLMHVFWKPVMFVQ
jgi:hypothetical protein